MKNQTVYILISAAVLVAMTTFGLAQAPANNAVATATFAGKGIGAGLAILLISCLGLLYRSNPRLGFAVLAIGITGVSIIRAVI